MLLAVLRCLACPLIFRGKEYNLTLSIKPRFEGLRNLIVMLFVCTDSSSCVYHCQRLPITCSLHKCCNTPLSYCWQSTCEVQCPSSVRYLPAACSTGCAHRYIQNSFIFGGRGPCRVISFVTFVWMFQLQTEFHFHLNCFRVVVVVVVLTD
jgi:hypothetical protein